MIQPVDAARPYTAPVPNPLTLRLRNRLHAAPPVMAVLFVCACAGFRAEAQEVPPPEARGASEPLENARIEYAQVMRAEPVYQTLRATSMVERCEAATPVDPGERRGLARVVSAVRDVLGTDTEVEEVDRSAGGECRMVPVEREFRRPIAYDVDYVHKGVKYRSRLPYDPGNRLRVRVSVTPVVLPAGER